MAGQTGGGHLLSAGGLANKTCVGVPPFGPPWSEGLDLFEILKSSLGVNTFFEGKKTFLNSYLHFLP